jgi:hypothetical protein
MDLFCEIVRTGIGAVMTDETVVREKVERERERVESRVYRQLRAACGEHEDDLRPLWEGIDENVQEYNKTSERRAEAYDEHVHDLVSELNGIDDGGTGKEIRSTITGLISEIDLPEATVPDVPANRPPTDPLYDSSRGYIANSRSINNRRSEE